MILWYPPADTSTSNPFLQMKTLTLFFSFLQDEKNQLMQVSLWIRQVRYMQEINLSVLFCFFSLLSSCFFLMLCHGYNYTPIDEFVSQTWFNPFLTWNSSHFEGINQININANKVWIPDIYLYNKYESLFRICFHVNIISFLDGVRCCVVMSQFYLLIF